MRLVIQAGWIAEHQGQIGAEAELKRQAAALQLLAPHRLQLLQQLRQIRAGQGLGIAGRLALQLGSQKDQAEAIDLFAAFAIDLPQRLAHQLRQIAAAQQRTDQGADGGQRRAHLVRESLQQGQLAAGARGW